MEKIIDFITNNPSYAIILLLILYIILEKFGVVNIMKLIRGTQEEKYPKLEKSHIEIIEEIHKQNLILSQQNEKFATNHSMHEIPDIKKSVDRIEKTLDGVVEIQREQGLDISRLKALAEK